MHVAVVGAGVVGISLARSLLDEGAGVTIVEAVGPGAGTSSRGAGLVSEGAWHPTSLALVRRSLDLLDAMGRLADARGSPFRFHRVGSTTLVPGSLADAARALARKQAAWGARVREVAPADVPALPRHAGIDASGVAAAFHYEDDGWALPRLYCEALATECRALGAIWERAAARLVVERDGGATLHADGERVRADVVVLAAGVHTRAILQAAGLDAPLQAYRTQAASVAHPRAHEVPILHDAVQGYYQRPGQPGHLLAGDGTTTAPEDVQRWRAEADDAFVAASLARVRRRFPFLADARPGDAHAGLDAATPDRLMLAGPFPGVDRLWLAVGGNGHGFMRAPALGESLAALLVGKTPRVDVGAYAPARFEGRAGGFEIREGYSLHADA